MPYAIGLQSAATAFVSAGFATQFTVAVIIFLSIILITSAFQKDASDAPISLPGMSLLHIMPFYRRRFDFLNRGIHATGQSIFQFKLLRNMVIVVSGESGRQAFFSAKGLDLTEGFKILSGAIPNVKGVTTDLQSRRIATIHKRVVAAQREGHLSTLSPHLLDDCRRVMERWGGSGKFDPFKNIYELTFQTTIRALSCAEIADDFALVSRIKKLYDKLDTGTTPATILLPWLPSWTMVNKLCYTKEIYDIIVEAVRQRQQLLTKIGEGEKPQDTMQLLLDAGDGTMDVVGFIMGLLIAGARATGTSASWLVTFLASHPEWAKKARAEVEELVAAHTNVQFSAPAAPAASPSETAQSGSATRAHTWPDHRPFPSTAIAAAIKTHAFPVTIPPPSPVIATPTSPSPSVAFGRPHDRPKRRGSQSSTISHKRKRCNSGSDVDLDPKPTHKKYQREQEKREVLAFPEGDYDAECMKKNRDVEEGWVIGGSAGSDSRRRRKDAIPSGVGLERIPSNPALQPPISNVHANAPVSPATPQLQSISETLKRIPLEIWETSTPVLDALIKETLRVAQPHTAMRRNVGPEFYIDGKLVPTGAYVVYPFSDVHLDEGIYKDAWKFDPGRWLNEGSDEENKKKQEGKGVPYGYVGWGGGKSVCLGTRLAKVELKLILSMFLLGYDLGIVDKSGKPSDTLPSPNWNDILLCRPPKGSFYVGFSRKDSALL